MHVVCKPRPSISLKAQRLELEKQRIRLLYQASNEMNRLNIWIGFLNTNIISYQNKLTNDMIDNPVICKDIIQKIESFVFLDIFDENEQTTNIIKSTPANIHFLQSSETNSVSIQNHILRIQTSNSILYESISTEIERLTSIIYVLSQNLLQILNLMINNRHRSSSNYKFNFSYAKKPRSSFKTPLILANKSSVYYLDSIPHVYQSDIENDDYLYNYMYTIDDDLAADNDQIYNELTKKYFNGMCGRFELLLFGYMRKLENELFLNSEIFRNDFDGNYRNSRNRNANIYNFFLNLKSILLIMKYFGGYFRFSTADKLRTIMNRRNSMRSYKHLIHIKNNGQYICCDNGYHGTILIGDYFSPKYNDQIYIYLTLLDIQSKHMALGFVSDHGSCILFYGNGITKMSGDFEFLNRQKINEFANVRFHTQTTIVIHVDSVLQTAKLYQECAGNDKNHDRKNKYKFDDNLCFLLEVNLPEKAAIAVYLKDCRQTLCIKKQIDANLFE